MCAQTYHITKIIAWDLKNKNEMNQFLDFEFNLYHPRVLITFYLTTVIYRPTEYHIKSQGDTPFYLSLHCFIRKITFNVTIGRDPTFSNFLFNI